MCANHYTAEAVLSSTQIDYSASEPTCLCSYLSVLWALRRTNKYQLYSLLLDPSATRNHLPIRAENTNHYTTWMHEHLKSKYIYAFVLQHSDPIALSMSERCFNRETLLVSIVEQELLTLPQHLSLSPVCSGGRVIRTLFLRYWSTFGIDVPLICLPPI